MTKGARPGRPSVARVGHRGAVRSASPNHSRMERGDAGKNVAAFKMLIFAQNDRVISIGEDANLPALGIDVPELKHSGSKVLVKLARHLARGVSLAENFHD